MALDEVEPRMDTMEPSGAPSTGDGGGTVPSASPQRMDGMGDSMDGMETGVGATSPSGSHPIILCPTKITLTSPQTVKAGDTLPEISVILQDANGTAVDLTNAATITFRYVNKLDTAGPQSKNASIFNAALGQVSADWGPFAEGVIQCEFHVVWTNGAAITFPDGDYLTLSVIAALA